MQKIVLDSDIIIDFIREASSLLFALFDQVDEGKTKLFIPSIVVTELIAGRETKTQAGLEKLELLLSRFGFIEMNYDISKATGILMRDHQGLNLADAIVAATTLNLNAKLATRNIKDFDMIKGLKFFKISMELE